MPGREYLLKNFTDPDIQAYYNYQLGIAELLGADRRTAEIDLKKMIEFEAKIAEVRFAYCFKANERVY